MLLKRRKLFVFLFLTVCIVIFIPISVSANSPARANFLIAYLDNVPETTVYVDVLIKLPRNNKNYVDCNEPVLSQFGLAKTCEMVTYNVDGFCSYSVHMAGAGYFDRIYPDFVDNKQKSVHFWDDYEAGYQYQYVREHFSKIKLAAIDKDGNVISVSEVFDINPTGGHLEYVDCNLASGDIHVAVATPSLFELFIGSLLFASVITIGIETLIGFIFRLKPLFYIPVVNLVSNLLFNISVPIFVLGLGMNYLLILVIGEIVIMISEFFAYRVIYKTTKITRLSIYTITANMASLLFGLGINQLTGLLSLL